MRPNQLHNLLSDGAERCNLEYLLDVWERCGGTYSVLLTHENDEPAIHNAETVVASEATVRNGSVS
jgi:hypothetical protein